jgi:hypothetical protein
MARPKDDAPVQAALTALTEKHVDIGFWHYDAHAYMENKRFTAVQKRRIITSRACVYILVMMTQYS